jgi:hypothetical protein
MPDAQGRPVRIQLSRRKGWRMPLGAVKVDRSTPWGNPFVVGQDGSAAECVRLYEAVLAVGICLTSTVPLEAQQSARNHVVDHWRELRGHDLACWCRAGTPCHANTLLLVANAPPRCEASDS